MADIAIPFIGRFWMYLISNIASIICSIFVLYYLLFDRTLRCSLHNHVVIVLIIINLVTQLTDIPWLIYQYLNGIVWIFTPFFCQTWRFIDSSTYSTTARLVAWASIERYILIFHDSWMSTKRKKTLLHYIPISAIVAYGILLYIIITFFLYCDRSYDPTITYCGFYSCAYNSAVFSMFEFVTSGITNSIIIASFSMTLIIRIVKQKHRLNQHVNWRKHRKMAIQLISITLLFYFLYLPNVIVAIVFGCGVPWSYLENFLAYGQFFSYYINFLLPFVCAGTLPHLRNKIKKILQLWPWHTRSAIEPSHNTVMFKAAGQSIVPTRFVH